MKIFTTTENETRRVAMDIAKKLPLGSVIALEGDLGAGKTVFAKGVAVALGVTEEVISPTFTILRSYRGTVGVLHHIDAYRLTGSDEGLAVGLDEVIGAEGSITIVEWWGIIGDLVPDNAVRVSINRVDDNTREIDIVDLWGK